MKNFNSWLILLLLISSFFGQTAWGQSNSSISTDDAFSAMEDLFKTNHTLVNGVFFVDKYRKDIGHPFLNSPYFSEGIINLNNINYADCKLGYNLVEQEIVILEKGDIKIERPFIPPIEFVKEFQISDMKFKKNTDDNRFYLQVYTCEQFAVEAYMYKKAAKSYHNKNNVAYKYSDIIADFFVLIDKQKFNITTKRSYLSLFSSDLEKKLDAYIKRNRISFKKSDVSQLKDLFIYTRELLQLKETNLVVN